MASESKPGVCLETYRDIAKEASVPIVLLPVSRASMNHHVGFNVRCTSELKRLVAAARAHDLEVLKAGSNFWKLR